MSDVPRLERAIGHVLRAGIVASTALLGAGLALTLVGVTAPASVLLNAGVVVLLATPVARVIVSIVEYVNQRDWRFAALTAIVLVELLVSAILALMFDTR